ncbi:MAG: aminopeptidase P family protein [Alphaproteobacteria bacterium]|nr:aminopeptidase P family protein [Alphaproteobacteria bacterium]
MFQIFDAASDPSLVAARIESLRRELAKRNIDALIVPRTDAHQGEYIPASEERLAWLTGFAGSAGTAIIAAKKAALFVDGRYTVQARSEVDTKVIDVVPMAEKTAEDWLAGELPEGARVAFDPKLFTLAQIQRLKRRLADKKIKVAAVSPRSNLIDALWRKPERPDPPSGAIVPHPVSLAGQSAAGKVSEIQERLKTLGLDAVVLTSRESIAWLFNLRGSDVKHTPVFSAFAIVHQRARPELFVELSKLGAAARKVLTPVAKVAGYDTFEERLKELKAGSRKVGLDPATASYAIATRLGGDRRIVRFSDPCVAPRAIKNAAEIAGTRAAHARDGVAVARFLAWLDDHAGSGDIDEIAAAQALESFRRDTGELKEISFDTIAGSGPNGAIVHYRVNAKTNRKLKPGELFLVDSGAQYSDGTTDITRTVAIGKPTNDMRRHFTLVLKGNVAIGTACFPKGTRGRDLDSLARGPLWQAGLDYDHGTGHGVGSYLSVHEGPVAISRTNAEVVLPGMILSNEPGFYREGHYGIRIENLVLVKEPEIPKGGERPMMSFETLTLAPIDRRLIDVDLLTGAERHWVDAYHARVQRTLQARLDKPTKSWLKAACAPL